ncbi:MAG: LPS export ABC transporter permease LptG [Candidatus Omnitrophica bacterium]|nr:LPS export ABC transporter permease LptG [Candidatus Omnitrophota bacterium]
MLILDRYLFRSFLRSFFFCLVVFIFLFIIIDIFGSLQEILRNHPDFLKIVELYLYAIPVIINQTSPVAALLATLITLGQMNQANEVIAMRSSGMSIWHIVRPMVLFGIALSLVIFVMNETVTPYAQKMSKFIKRYYVDKAYESAQDVPLENVAIYGYGNRLFFLNKFYPKSNTIDGLTILEHDPQQNVRSKIYAEKAVWRNNRWVLYQCFIYHLGEGQKIRGEPLYFTDKVYRIEETPEDFMRQNIPVENMNVKDLAGYISRLPEAGAQNTVRRLRVDLFQKTSFPFTSLIIILLGIPSAIIVRRRAVAFSSIGLCMAISFFFYVTFAVTTALGKAGALPPFLAAWGSHFIFGGAAFYLIARIP